MRPKRLEIEGFGSFRERSVIDFEGAELFVLCGPTGSGKSTIIDGVTFALYGSVPRYQKSNLVRPVISNGKEEARVCLDFEVGADTFTAIRVVRRTAQGASTREARLVCGDRVLAGTADEVSAEVENLLGLSFDHFQKCVVLPQGAFAQLLHDGQASRLQLLRSLLEIEVYSRMRVLASGRAERAKQEWEVLDGRLANELAGATGEALAAAQQRRDVLVGLVADLRTEAQKLAQLNESIRGAKEALAAQEQATTLLAGIAAPEGLDQLGNELERAHEALTGSEQATSLAESAMEEARAARAELPEREAMERLLRAHDDISVARDASQRHADERERAATALGEGERVLEEAALALDEARTRRELALRDNHAFAAARSLQAGDRCPVCGETLQEAPRLEAPPEYQDANEVFKAAERAHQDAVRGEQQHRSRLALCEQEMERATDRLAELERAVAGQLEREEVEARLRAIAAAEASTEEAQRRWSAAQAEVRAARAAVESARERSDGVIRLLGAARDTVSAFGPPPIDRQDAAGAWRLLAEWAADELSVRRAKLETLAEQAASLEAGRAESVRIQSALCGDAGVAIDDAEPLEAATTALARAEDAVAAIARQLETADELRESQQQLTDREQVARQLARHLRADPTGFEAWYVRQVVEHLTYAASQTLMSLSAGQFSLALADNDDFEVVDHANADARRHIRTLSGGETFLASLALALALADSIATVAAGSTARLDAIFLDEGFGTLDPETLDVVASAIEELAAEGRVVGLVTHVAELAARMPVRFEVRRGPRGSTVERVEG